MTEGIDRSIPPVMTTSIWPSAATARKVVNGQICENDVALTVFGAMTSETSTSIAAMSQTGTNPLALSARPESLPSRPPERDATCTAQAGYIAASTSGGTSVDAGASPGMSGLQDDSSTCRIFAGTTISAGTSSPASDIIPAVSAMRESKPPPDEK